MVFACESASQLDDVVAGEFDDATASAADHVVVGVFAETEFVVGLLHVETHLFENAAIDQKRQRSVDRSLGDALPALTQCEQQLFRFEVVGNAEHGVEDVLPRRGVFDVSVFEVALERETRLFRVDVRFDFDHGSSR